jgi:hypothetical protein
MLACEVLLLLAGIGLLDAGVAWPAFCCFVGSAGLSVAMARAMP